MATPLLNADIATMAADAVGEDVDIMREPVQFPGLAPSFVIGNGDFNPTNCPYNPVTHRLECPVVVRNNGLSITRSYAFFGAADAVQQAYDALLTVRANILADVVGSHTSTNWSATINRHRDFNVTGLLGTETQRTWNGTGTSSATRSRHSDEGAERSYDIDCTMIAANVVVPVPNGADRFPISGTVTRHCTITFSGGPRDGQTVERTAVLTFNGTETASMTVGDRTFDVNLRDRHRGPGRP